MALLRALLNLILSLVRKPRLPHPEEPPRPWQKAADIHEEDTLFESVFDEFMRSYEIPEDSREMLRNTTIWEFFDAWPPSMLQGSGGTLLSNTPAATWVDDGIRHVAALAPYVVPGIFAHEAGGHGAWARLTDPQRNDFATTYESVKEASLIQLLWRTNTYGLSSVVECHAELYRYLGQSMPEALNLYYPQLF